MKKLLVLLILVTAITLTMVACSNNEKDEPTPSTTIQEQETTAVLKDGVYKIVIPNSYLNFFNITSKEMLNSFNKLGDQYIKSAAIVDEGVVLEADRFQLDDIIEKNDSDSSKYIDSFLDESSNNCFLSCTNYSEIEFYYDKSTDKTVLYNTVKSMASVYSLNYMLYNRNSDWDIKVIITDCDTNEIIVEGSLLEDDIMAKLK